MNIIAWIILNQEDVNNETLFVTDELLEPFFVTPSNNSLLYGNVTLWAGEATGREVSSATFWYSEDGVNWSYIGIDDDGSEPTVAENSSRFRIGVMAGVCIGTLQVSKKDGIISK